MNKIANHLHLLHLLFTHPSTSHIITASHCFLLRIQERMDIIFLTEANAAVKERILHKIKSVLPGRATASAVQASAVKAGMLMFKRQSSYSSRGNRPFSQTVLIMNT